VLHKDVGLQLNIQISQGTGSNYLA